MHAPRTHSPCPEQSQSSCGFGELGENPGLVIGCLVSSFERLDLGVGTLGSGDMVQFSVLCLVPSVLYPVFNVLGFGFGRYGTCIGVKTPWKTRNLKSQSRSGDCEGGKTEREVLPAKAPVAGSGQRDSTGF